MAKEVDTVNELIKDNKSFLLSGGAGSGKTHSLIEILKSVYEQNPSARIACITYTNTAVDEIKARAPYSELDVSTIHEFIWGVIKLYQKDLKKSLALLIASGVVGYNGEKTLDGDYFNDLSISYKDWKSLESGVISHDEVLLVADHMFANNKLLSDILKDTYDFVFIDEYQDTSDEVMRILLEHMKLSEKSNVLGFFGDRMQAIYKSSTDSVQSLLDGSNIVEVKKEDNRRNPGNVISLINKLRTDDLTQKQADDPNAPNYGKEGSIKFLYTNNETYDIEAIKQTTFFDGWDFDDIEENKELYLVKNLIASKAGFPALMAIYDKDQVIAYKKRIKDEIKSKSLEVDESLTFGEVIQIVNKAPTPGTKTFLDANPELYESARAMSYSSIKSIYLDTDQLFGDKKNSEASSRGKDNKRDALINHLFQIQECIELYSNADFNRFIKKTNFPLKSIESKKKLKDAIETLCGMSNKSIESVIEYADKQRIWLKDDRLNDFCENKKYVYDRVKSVEFKELIALYDYIEDHTPYSTQHSIKGAEFSNVLVILDNGGWNNYNFTYLFESTTGKESVVDRTAKLFYVCCSRAKQNLIVVFHRPSAAVIAKATEWFGVDNVVDLD